MLIITMMYMWITYKSNNTLPEESIRFRIIGNSNERIDQTTKLLIKKELEKKGHNVYVITTKTPGAPLNEKGVSAALTSKIF